MVGLTALWMPILVAAVIAFVASAIIHMALGYHKGDWARMPGEPNIMEAIRKEGVSPGDYCMPHAGSMSEMGSPAFVERCKQGPVGMLTVKPSGAPSMGKALGVWFVYLVVVGVMVAYVTGRVLEPGTHYLRVFRVAGTVAFLAYAGAEPINSIWIGRKWSTTLKNVFDGLVYALLTAGVFGWLWPR